jgi:hypothetical protein
MVTAQCPYCFATDEVPDEYAGRVTKCLTCGKSFTIKFVPALYRESATPVVVTPKKAIHMGESKPGKPRPNRNGDDGAERPIDVQSREIFAEMTQSASVESHGPAVGKIELREPSLVDDLQEIDSALTLAKTAVGFGIVGLIALCAYTAFIGQYVGAAACVGLAVVLFAVLNFLRASERAFTNIVRAVLEVKRKTGG